MCKHTVCQPLSFNYCSIGLPSGLPSYPQRFIFKLKKYISWSKNVLVFSLNLDNICLFKKSCSLFIIFDDLFTLGGKVCCPLFMCHIWVYPLEASNLYCCFMFQRGLAFFLSYQHLSFFKISAQLIALGRFRNSFTHTKHSGRHTHTMMIQW